MSFHFLLAELAETDPDGKAFSGVLPKLPGSLPTPIRTLPWADLSRSHPLQ